MQYAGDNTQRLSQNTIEFIDIHFCAICLSSQVACCVEHFEVSWKSTQTPLYNNFLARCSSFSKSSYTDHLKNKNIKKNVGSSLSSDSQLVFLNRAFSKYQPSFAMQSSIFSARFTLITFLNLAWGRLLKNVWTSLITSLFDANLQPRKYFLMVGNNQKSHGVRSGDYGGWGGSTLVFSRYLCTSCAVWGRALSWCKIRWFFNFRHFQLTCHQRIFKTSR